MRSWYDRLLRKLGLVPTTQAALRDRLVALSQRYPHGPATVVLHGVGAHRLKTAAALGEITGWELDDVLALMRMAPLPLLVNVAAESARQIQAQLEAAGAIVVIQGLPATADESSSLPATRPRSPARQKSRSLAAPLARTSAGFSLRLLDAGPDKESVIHLLQELTGLSLVETRALVDSAPCQVLQQIDSHTGRAAQKRLATLGATSELVGGIAATTTLAVPSPGAHHAGLTHPDNSTFLFGNFNVILREAGPYPEQVMVILRDLLNYRRLTEIEQMVAQTPQRIVQSVPLETAETIKMRLEAVGAVVEVR
ncbi:MAG TPA: ribosomal protein L7/L12 [Anaerolineae bacterium]